MPSYTKITLADGVTVRVDAVLRDDGAHVLTGVMLDRSGNPVTVAVQGDAGPTEAYQAWLKGGGIVGDPLPKPAEAYGDDLITVLSDAELAAMSSGTLRDQRMLSAQRVPFRASDDVIARLAAAMKIDPAAWLARVVKPAAG